MALDAQLANRELSHASPKEVLAWAWEEFGAGLAITSSFQTQSVPLLHMVSQVAPQVPVLFLDTGYHFPETLSFRDEVAKAFGLRVENITNDLGHTGFLRAHGELYRTDPDACCYLNKVAPLERAMSDFQAWVSGIRRDQTFARRDTQVVSQEGGRYKICPLANWTEFHVADYIERHELPKHPLSDHGYRSIGCAPCTRPVAEDEDARAGRWAGREKTECGLHHLLSDSTSTTS